jgi:hypothetical protein
VTSPLRGPENSEGGGFAAADSLRRTAGGCGPAPGFDKGTLARTLIGPYGQVASLPDRRQAYGSSPPVRSLHPQRCRRAGRPAPASCGHEQPSPAPVRRRRRFVSLARRSARAEMRSPDRVLGAWPAAQRPGRPPPPGSTPQSAEPPRAIRRGRMTAVQVGLRIPLNQRCKIARNLADAARRDLPLTPGTPGQQVTDASDRRALAVSLVPQRAQVTDSLFGNLIADTGIHDDPGRPGPGVRRHRPHGGNAKEPGRDLPGEPASRTRPPADRPHRLPKRHLRQRPASCHTRHPTARPTPRTPGLRAHPTFVPMLRALHIDPRAAPALTGTYPGEPPGGRHHRTRRRGAQRPGRVKDQPRPTRKGSSGASSTIS